MANTANDAQGDAVITFAPNETVTVQGVNLATLQAHPGAFYF
jgi:hypothetical protein